LHLSCSHVYKVHAQLAQASLVEQ